MGEFAKNLVALRAESSSVTMCTSPAGMRRGSNTKLDSAESCSGTSFHSYSISTQESRREMFVQRSGAQGLSHWFFEKCCATWKDRLL